MQLVPVRTETNEDLAKAGEFALDLLDRDERRAFVTRLNRSADLRKMVREWDDYLYDYNDQFAPMIPNPRVKARIDERVGIRQSSDVPISRAYHISRVLLGVFVGILVAIIVLARLDFPLL